MLRYPAILHTEGDGFWIEFPDFPGSYTWGGAGDDPEDLAANCLADSVSSLMRESQPLPLPSTVAAPTFLVSPHYTERGLVEGRRVPERIYREAHDRFPLEPAQVERPGRAA